MSASKRCAMTATGRAGWGTYPAANQLVRRFVEQKILRETTGQVRHRRFQYDGYVRLFTEEDHSSVS
jgi:hypothetical protein